MRGGLVPTMDVPSSENTMEFQDRDGGSVLRAQG